MFSPVACKSETVAESQNDCEASPVGACGAASIVNVTDVLDSLIQLVVSLLASA